MPSAIDAILDLLSCPDDGQPLQLAGTQLRCNRCDRCFPLHGEHFAEILPSRPAGPPAFGNAEYGSAYLKLFEQEFREDNTCLAWGAEEAATAAWVSKRRRRG